MPNRIKLSRSRLLFCKLQLHLYREAALAIFGTERFGAVATDAVLCAAIFVGQLEGRPMTAAKLAIYTGVPRPTVARKLRELAERGLVEIDGGRATMVVSVVNSADVVETHAAAIGRVREFVRKVSKLDT